MLGIIEIFLFLCVVYYLFGKRTGDMVDMMSTRLQEAYGSWTYNGFGWGDGGGQHDEERSTFDFLLRRLSEVQRWKRTITSQDDYEIPREEESMEITSVPQGLACRYCAPGSECQLDPQERRRDVIDVLRTTQHVNQGPTKSWWNLATYFPILAQCLRVRKYHFPEVSAAVLKDQRVVAAIEEATIEAVREERQAAEVQGKKFSDTETYTRMLAGQKRRARKVMKDMRAKMSNVLLQITSWLIYTLLPCFLTGAVAHPAQIEMLKAASRRTPKTPLIFLPLHRSHLDYILVTFMLLNNDLRVPVIAAGNNLRIPFFGEALRGLGAFYIKRKIDPITGKKDIVYRAILNAYLQHCLTAGHNAEFFIEGGRTRTGKPCIPKGGILSVIVEAFLDKTLPDVLLVPVSVNYERLVDGNFVAEQLGQRKPPETFLSAISAIWKAIKSNYGTMRIDFNEPFSLKELVDAFKRNQAEHHHHTSPRRRRCEPGDRFLQQTKSSTSLYGTDIVQEDNRCLVDSIARHVVYDCASATSVMSTNAVTFLLLTQFRRGVTLSVLARALDRLRADLAGMKDFGFTGDSEETIRYVLGLLGRHLITMDTINGGVELFVKPVNTVPAMLELAYYANTLMPFYVLEAIITSALYALMPPQDDGTPTLTAVEAFVLLEEDILEMCHKFCDILRYEFILNKPCQDLDTLLRDMLHKMSDRDLISIPKKMYKTLCKGIEEEKDKDYVTYEEENVVLVNMNKRVNYVNSIAILAPITRTYLTVVDYLHRLLENAQLEVEFIKGAIAEIRQKFDNQECEFGECVSVEMIKNCLKLLEKWSVVQVECAGGVRLLSLTHHYNSSAGIEEIYQKIQTFNCINHFTFNSE